MERYLAGRVAVVTGGASGMGRAMALAFAERGAAVAIGSLLREDQQEECDREVVYLPDKGELEEVCSEIEKLGVTSLGMALDVRSDHSMDLFFKEVERVLGAPDILANAAGMSADQPLAQHPDDLWNKVIDVNLNGTYRAIKRALPGMIERGFGRIINIASTAGSVGAVGCSAYCASKAAVIGLTRVVALEGAEHGVTCNSISPGWVETPFGTGWMKQIGDEMKGSSSAQYIDRVKADNPQKRMVQPEEVGALAAYLCREEALGITMQDLTVSAGALW